MLIATIHDVAPVHLEAVRRLRDRLTAWGVARATLLVVPHFHGTTRCDADPATVAWLRMRAAAGDEIALHGVEHRAIGAIRGACARLRAAVWTAGEAELLATRPPAARLRAERDRLANVLGTEVPGFVAPAWLEPAGFTEVLSRCGFHWHETRFAIERLSDRATLRAPVIGFATRTWLRETLAVAYVRAAMPVLRASRRALRIALHPADLQSTRVMAAAEAAVRGAAELPAITTGEALAAA